MAVKDTTDSVCVNRNCFYDSDNTIVFSNKIQDDVENYVSLLDRPQPPTRKGQLIDDVRACVRARA